MGKKGRAGQMKLAKKAAKKKAHSAGINKPLPLPHKKVVKLARHSPAASPKKGPVQGTSAPAHAPTPRCPYVSNHRTLLLGEGDFSFAAALSILWGDSTNLVATAYDDEDIAIGKYVGLRENVETVRGVGGTVVFCVDATQCHTHALLRRFGLFDRIIFNFPHAGAGIKDQKRNVATNQSLLRATFTASVQLLAPGGQMHITLKRGQPYDSWGAVVIAKMCGLRVLSCSTFSPEAFPGYAHRRTLGDEHAGDADAHLPNAEISVGAKTYAFVSAEDAAAAAAEREPRKGQKNHKALYKHTPFGMRKM